jgi:hypothetical protein
VRICELISVSVFASVVAGCSERGPRTLAEGETATYEGGAAVKVANVAHNPMENGDWITSILVLEPNPSAHTYRKGQPIRCVFETEVPAGLPQPSDVMAEIKKGQVTYGMQRPNRITRVRQGIYRFDVSFAAGVRKPGRYELRACACRTELPVGGDRSSPDPIVRRSYSLPALLEIEP